MSNEDRAILMNADRASRRAKVTRIFIGVLMALLVFVTLITWQLGVQNGELAAQNKEIALAQAQEKQALAQDFLGTACKQPSFRDSPAGKSACPKAQTAADENPEDVVSQPVAGPAGRDGKDGRDGIDGVDGADGKDGVNGKDGKNGLDGKDGIDGVSVTGPMGPEGPMGPMGPAGPEGAAGQPGKDGTDGMDGKDGEPPSSITYTDGPMAGYTCVPNPPGSTTYTCSQTQPTPAPTATP